MVTVGQQLLQQDLAGGHTIHLKISNLLVEQRSVHWTLWQ